MTAPLKAVDGNADLIHLMNDLGARAQAAARRLSLASVAMTQFVTPVMQFVVGVVILSEPMPASRWIGFGLVWLAVLVLLADLSRRRRTPRGTRR